MMSDAPKIHPTKSKKRNHNNMSNNKNSNNSQKKEDVKLSKALSWVLRHKAPSLGLTLSADGYVPLENLLSLNHSKFRHNGRPKYTVEDVERVVKDNDKQRFRLEYRDRDVVLAEGGEFASSSNENNNDNDGDAARGDDHADTNAGEEGNDDNEQHNTDASTTTNNDINATENKNKVLCIRANQGHSVKGLQANQLLTPLTTEELSNPNLSIIHGTTRKAWGDHIRHEGLSRMKRNHIHCATGLPPAATNKKKHKDENNKMENGTSISGSANRVISGMRSSSQIHIYINGRKSANDGIPFYRSDNGVILTAGVNEEGMLPVNYFEKVVDASSGKVLQPQEDEEH